MTSTDRERSEDDTGIVAENIKLELGLLKGPKYGHFKYYACWDPRLMGVFKDWSAIQPLIEGWGALSRVQRCSTFEEADQMVKNNDPDRIARLMAQLSLAARPPADAATSSPQPIRSTRPSAAAPPTSRPADARSGNTATYTSAPRTPVRSSSAQVAGAGLASPFVYSRSTQGGRSTRVSQSASSSVSSTPRIVRSPSPTVSNVSSVNVSAITRAGVADAAPLRKNWMDARGSKPSGGWPWHAVARGASVGVFSDAHYATYLCEKHSNPVRMGFRDKEMARSWLKAYFEGKDV